MAKILAIETSGSNCGVGIWSTENEPIIIEENAKVGANAVVLKNVPKDAVMIGIPAKYINEKDKVKDEKFRPYGVKINND